MNDTPRSDDQTSAPAMLSASSGRNQPYRAPSLSANTNRNIPAAIRHTPGTSMLTRRARGSSRRTNSNTPRMASGATITLIPNAHRQV